MKLFSSECIPNTRGDLGEGLLWDERNQTIMWVDAFKKIIRTLLEYRSRLRLILNMFYSKLCNYVTKYNPPS